MVEQNPLVSVIIPYFNKVSTIERSVDSVINQTYNNWEIIIVDDCSNLKLEKLAKWDNYNITVLYNETNLGPGPSRQKALDMSKGEYVAFLDADDWWEPDFFIVSIENHSVDISATWVQTNVILNNFENNIRRYNERGFTDIPTTIIQFGHTWQTGSLLWKKSMCGNWGNLSTHQDSYFEISSSLNCRKVRPIGKVLFNHDETGLDHRNKYVKSNRIFMNNFDLYGYIFECYNKKINFHYRLVLFHRLLRCMLKILENCEKDQIQLYQNKFKEMYFFIVFLGKSIRLYKLIHYSLQYTKYRIYF
jgi:glycosyltransferase involved in cell wall biosynthesis